MRNSIGWVHTDAEQRRKKKKSQKLRHAHRKTQTPGAPRSVALAIVAFVIYLNQLDPFEMNCE